MKGDYFTFESLFPEQNPLQLVLFSNKSRNSYLFKVYTLFQFKMMILLLANKIYLYSNCFFVTTQKHRWKNEVILVIY